MSIHSCSQFTGLYGLATANVPRMATTAMSHSNSNVLICLANLRPCHEVIKSSGLLHSTPTTFSPAQNKRSILYGVLKCTTPSASVKLDSSLVSATRLVHLASKSPLLISDPFLTSIIILYVPLIEYYIIWCVKCYLVQALYA